MLRSTIPKRRASLNLITVPSSVVKIRWSCFSSFEGRLVVIETRPDIPKCRIITVSSSKYQRIYFALRKISITRRPFKRSTKLSGIGHRSVLQRVSISINVFPSRTGRIPRTTVSTSGSSGINSIP